MKIIDIDAETMLPLTDEERNDLNNRKLGRFFLKKLAVATVAGVALAVVIKKLDSADNAETMTSDY